MKKVFYVLLLVAFMLPLMSNSGCEHKTKPTADKELQKRTEQSMNEANRQVGMPAIVNFQEKKLMKQIYELRDQENLYICFY